MNWCKSYIYKHAKVRNSIQSGTQPQKQIPFLTFTHINSVHLFSLTFLWSFSYAWNWTGCCPPTASSKTQMPLGFSGERSSDSVRQCLCWRRWPCYGFKETQHRLVFCRNTAWLVLTQLHAPRFAAAGDGEAQDAAPADEEGGAQFIPAEHSSSSFPLFILHERCT